MKNIMKKPLYTCLALLFVVLLAAPASLTTYAAEEKTPAPSYVGITGRDITWEPAEIKGNLKFRIYYKDKWSGESYRLVATRKGYDDENYSSLNSIFSFRDATNEEDPQIIIEKKDGYTYYSLPAISGHKYKVAVKTYDEDYGLWSDKSTVEYYFMSTPEASVELADKGVRLTWKPVQGATKYYVARIDISSKYYDVKTFKIVGSDQTEFIDEDAIEGDSYLYQVFAGRGSWKSHANYLNPIRVAF